MRIKTQRHHAPQRFATPQTAVSSGMSHITVKETAKAQSRSKLRLRASAFDLSLALVSRPCQGVRTLMSKPQGELAEAVMSTLPRHRSPWMTPCMNRRTHLHMVRRALRVSFHRVLKVRSILCIACKGP